MKLSKTLEQMGVMIFEMNVLAYLLFMIVYIVLTPIWLPIYLGAKFYELLKDE